jgi:hypothetical protein
MIEEARTHTVVTFAFMDTLTARQANLLIAIR